MSTPETLSRQNVPPARDPADPQGETARPSLLGEVAARRVPQFLGLYVGGATSAVLFAEFLVGRYGLSPYLVDVLLAALVLALPAVGLVAWAHGAPGRQRWTRRQTGAVAANALLGLGALGLLFWGKPLGATTTTVEVETADGETVERTVAKAAFRRRVVVADFGGDAALGPAVSYALARDLRQDLFVTTYGAGALRGPLREAGFETPAQAPLALVREAADELLVDALVTGTVERTADGFRLTAERHPIQRPGRADQYIVEGPSVQRLIDELSIRIRDDLGLPEGHTAETDDRAVEDVLTGSVDALVAWGRGVHALNFLDDPEAPVAHFRQAVALDSTFAVANAILGTTLNGLAREPEAVDAYRAGQRHRYRLTEADRFMLDARIAHAEQRPDDARAIVREWAAFYPDDVEAQEQLAAWASYADDAEEAIAAYRRLIEIDPANPLRRFQLASALYAEQQYDQALTEMEAYIAAVPDDPDGYASLAAFHSVDGDLDAAIEAVQQAIRRDPTDPQYRRILAGYHLLAGDWRASEAAYRRVASESAEPTQTGFALQSLAHLYDTRGQLGRAAETLDQAWELYRPAMPRVQLLAAQLGEGYHYTRAGRTDDFERFMAQALDQPEAQTDPGYRGQISAGAAYAYAQTGQTARSLRYAATADSLYAAYGSATGKPWVDAVRGLAEMRRERWARAARLLAAYAQDNPAPSEFTMAYAEALLAAGDTERARTVADELRTRAPGYPRPRLVLARLDARADPAAARRHLDVALAAWADADPGFAPARRARALRQRLGG